MSKPWANIGAWTADTERAEAKERESAESQSFPSIKEAVTAKPKKKKTMTLMEFNNAVASANTDQARNEMLRLLTVPKERSYEVMQSNDGRWGGGRRSYGGFNDERRAGHPPPSRVFHFDQPSRADKFTIN